VKSTLVPCQFLKLTADKGEGVNVCGDQMTVSTTHEKYAIPEDVIWTELGDEIVILKLDRGIYFGLETVGARIWTLIARGYNSGEVVTTIGSEYAVLPERVEADFADLVSELSREGLVEAVR
jgi:hypothetical protein